MNKILIIDDEINICEALSFALEEKYEIKIAHNSKEAFKVLKSENVDAVLLDMRLGEENGLDILKTIKHEYPSLEVIILTAYGSIKNSVEAVKMGAFYYITKPVDLNELEIYLSQAVQKTKANREMEKKDNQTLADTSLNFVGSSSSIRKVFELVNKVKDIDSTVLITGESGTGKELVARAIHTLGIRRNKPFQVVNCAALPDNLIESELFGYEKGAFTGAVSRYEGKFLLANQGTLFLDEIGEMELGLQAKLLRVLQDKVVTPLGSREQRKVDVRIIAATNKDLKEEVKKGNFRQDLYYRLNVIEIKLPPLRERKEDIPLLVSFFLKKFAARLGQNPKHISPAAMIVLEHYNYPGNVRELENILERACAVSEGDVIEISDLPGYIFEDIEEANYSKEEEEVITIRYGEPLDEVERKVILLNLAKLNRPKKEIARLLGISERTLRNKLKNYYENGDLMD
ncbi:sigma-54 dependent transcriptional regulator [Thermosyntropha sp.]|uniref:sigma-54-dependent transcriptional regulator n=1 Tax=Thermosyntropha sp. TaxID=2740820 RepID=UPI0025EE36D1|nr:sigma-54 dependent transcriptional regulator [Thermosyntropha sp.]